MRNMSALLQRFMALAFPLWAGITFFMALMAWAENPTKATYLMASAGVMLAYAIWAELKLTMREMRAERERDCCWFFRLIWMRRDEHE